MKSGEVADGGQDRQSLKEVRKAYGRRGYIAVAFKESTEFRRCRQERKLSIRR